MTGVITYNHPKYYFFLIRHWRSWRTRCRGWDWVLSRRTVRSRASCDWRRAWSPTPAPSCPTAAPLSNSIRHGLQRNFRQILLLCYKPQKYIIFYIVNGSFFDFRKSNPSNGLIFRFLLKPRLWKNKAPLLNLDPWVNKNHNRDLWYFPPLTQSAVKAVSDFQGLYLVSLQCASKSLYLIAPLGTKIWSKRSVKKLMNKKRDLSNKRNTN